MCVFRLLLLRPSLRSNLSSREFVVVNFSVFWSSLGMLLSIFLRKLVDIFPTGLPELSKPCRAFKEKLLASNDPHPPKTQNVEKTMVLLRFRSKMSQKHLFYCVFAPTTSKSMCFIWFSLQKKLCFLCVWAQL